MLDVKPLAISGVAIVTPRRFEDDRGYFEESFNLRNFTEAVAPNGSSGSDLSFVQDNESRSNLEGTVRGLHYQTDPAAQGKLVRVSSGAILDVVVDLRRSSDTYLQHVAVEIDAESGRQLWVPPGMGHGFCTLRPMTVIQYKVTTYYHPDADRSIHWSDPALGIDWPVDPDRVVLSDKDAAAPTVAEAEEAGDVFD